MNGFSDRGSTPLSSIIKKPKKCSVLKDFREFRKCETGRFRPKKTSLKHIKCGKKISNVKLFVGLKKQEKVCQALYQRHSKSGDLQAVYFE